MALFRTQLWRYIRALAVPVLLWGLVVFALREPLQIWLQGDARFDEEAVREWIKEARVQKTLPEMAAGYLAQLEEYRKVERESRSRSNNDESRLEQARDQALRKREEIGEHLQAIGNPPTKMYSAQLPLFPIIYRLEVAFETEPGLPPPLAEPIAWESQVSRRPGQYRELSDYRIYPHATVDVQYQVHAYNKRQHNEQRAQNRLRWLSLLAVAATGLSLWWMYLVQHRERERQRQRSQAQQQINQTERLLLEEELRRQEAERRHEDTQRQLLEQQLATQAAEWRALELRSQVYASIGIMAGSYAHNIKNLLVRPNDLLRRCLEADGVSEHQQEMLQEVQHTLGTVTERLQQILRTVHRDPTRTELTRVDLHAVAHDICATWNDLAREKWKLSLRLEADPEPLWIQADLSHLQQAVENLLFNARDATFEMRNHLRDSAHQSTELNPAARRQALIAAAAWRGSVVLRVRKEAERAVLEVVDNGIGMTEEVRRRCTETHFTTKRDNAVYEGISTGMGLGLSFVVVVLEHHHATLAIDSAPQAGTTMRLGFPLAPTPTT